MDMHILSNPCRTTGCIGGWACILRHEVVDVDKARRLLKLDYVEADTLFYLGNWPTKYSIGYRNAKSLRGIIKVTVNRINHFIKTKGAE